MRGFPVSVAFLFYLDMNYTKDDCYCIYPYRTRTC
jgi:hypothetical protein